MAPELPATSQASSTDYYGDDDSQFLEALANAVLPGDLPLNAPEPTGAKELEPPPLTQPRRRLSRSPTPEKVEVDEGKRREEGDEGDVDMHDEEDEEEDEEEEELEPPPPAQPRKRARSPSVEVGDIQANLNVVRAAAKDSVYGAATFGDFGQYMSRKRAKLQIQNAAMEEGGSSTEGKSQIFKGLAIYVNGWTRPSVQEIRKLVVQHGGVFMPYLDRKSLVTHIITCSLTPTKIREFKHMKVVRPEWLVESAEKGQLLPWSNYIYVHDENQGNKARQTQQNLSTQEFSSAGPSSSSSVTPAPAPAAVPRPTYLFGGKKQNPPSPKPASDPDPLYCTDPARKEDAARVPGYAADKSNPHAQRAMANPEWRRAHTSVAADFIEGYYKNSRLHHLSTWKAELKALVQEAQERAEAGGGMGHVGKVGSEVGGAGEGGSGTGVGPGTGTGTGVAGQGVSMRGTELVMAKSPSKWKGKGKAMDDDDRVIMHCDFDCFFVSAGLVSRPELKGKPVVVCHSQGGQGGASSTSEIASSSYEARKFGIKNGMSLQQAKKLCPEVITIPYEFERYKQFSLLFYTALMGFADDLQAVSVDEALIEVTQKLKEWRSQPRYGESSGDPAKDLAEAIRDEVRRVTSCEVSIGIAHNIMLARLATRRAKPGGSYHLLPAEIPEFIAPLDIADLHGFGWSTKQKAQEKLGVTKLGELAKKSKGVLMDVLGKASGETLYNAIRGIDDKKLESDKPRKSVSCEINYGIRFENNEQAEEFIRQMAKEVKARLDAINMVGRSLTLKIMKRDPKAPVEPPKFLGHGLCDLFNKQAPLMGPGGKATSDDRVIADHAWKLLSSFNFDPRELRGIGIQIQKLESATGTTSVAPGQATLKFPTRVTSPTKASTSKVTLSAKPGPSVPLANLGRDYTAGDPVKPSLELPSFSQIDRSVFDALPAEIRQELNDEYKRRSASPFVDNPTAALHRERSAQPPAFQAKHNNNIFPSNKPAPNYKRVAQQLAPPGRASISPHKNDIVAWVARQQAKKKPKGIRISDAALRDLKLDPEVFRALPMRVQSEQLIMARMLKEKGHIPEPPTERKVLKPKKYVLPPDFVPYIAPKPKARHPAPPFLRQQGKTKKEKLYFTETDDIQRIVETWVMTYRHWAPREKDVEFLAKFISQSADRAQATDVGVERAVAVMKWWMVLLRRFFGATEYMDEEDLACSQRDLVGEAWWDAFYDVKDKMDAITKERFGGRISLN